MKVVVSLVSASLAFFDGIIWNKAFFQEMIEMEIPLSLSFEIVMSHVNSDCSEDSWFTKGPCVADLRAVSITPHIRKPQPDVRIFRALGYYTFTEDELFCTSDYKLFIPVSPTINGITNMQPSSNLLSQLEDIPWEHVCPKGFDFRTWNNVHRECVHIMKVPKNAVAEIVTVNTLPHSASGLSHPIHLHGYDMYVMEMGLLQKGLPFNESFPMLLRCLECNKQPKIPLDMVLKDTIPLSSGGYIVTRIFTANPVCMSGSKDFGRFNCHFLYHHDSGMRGVLQYTIMILWGKNKNLKNLFGLVSREAEYSTSVVLVIEASSCRYPLRMECGHSQSCDRIWRVLYQRLQSTQADVEYPSVQASLYCV
ncbi:hypothetical protein J6590_068733 [Homalodisca vitripennis]|nr:hypothetical protein J6590_068733 [Homalodisca vitripennis]